MSHLELNQIVQRYGSHTVVDGVSFHVDTGSIACLLGPSGCGKTTLLRCIAGFEPIAEGEIRIKGQSFSRPDQYLAPEKRQIGMVFQDYALFPHLTIAENIAFGLRNIDASQRQTRVDELLDTVGLNGLGRKYPHELSGGQQQRVALARALAPRPQLILLDEPFSNLDVDLRERLSVEVRSILKKEGMTAILVTHDQHEAFAMADEIGIMSGGKIQQWDTPYNLYHRPANRFVADFVGQGTFLPGTIIDSHHVAVETGLLESNTALACLPADAAVGKGCRVEILIRPDDVVHDDASPLTGEVTHRAFRGAEFLYTLRLASGAELLSLVSSHHNHAIGEKIGFRLEIDDVVAFRTDRPYPATL